LGHGASSGFGQPAASHSATYIRRSERVIIGYASGAKTLMSNWVVTENGKIPVTDQMKEDRAGMIAEVLGNPERWNSHGRGIGIK
jgi:hypothetical protein